MEILYTYINEKYHKFLIDKYIKECDIEFRNKILSYRRWQDTQLSLLGRILLRYGLDKFYNIKEAIIRTTSYNKPFLNNKNIYFNITHAENMVACAIAKYPIGIDVEFLNLRIDYTEFRSQMTSNELKKIHASEDKIGSFFEYWTEKEAVIKAYGKGLLVPLKSFEVNNKQCFIDNEKYYLKSIFLNKKYKCNIASKDKHIITNNIHIQQINFIF
ncbi:4'-phosphopantetheinyl transferase family protein [Parabacteroides merdae]|uniref:4-phosphopantetheinyl transferase n=1 Tax=Parabacteroides merdae TaxID=46503 RepID=A0A414BUT8_9BACT|nr:4'-phosphopantetheinyl transferase superfamily protein [Parabacteroides merdae]RHC81533.1 4-phosphopantetheinyl transferase [Parabacteroides merdae]